MIRRLLEAINIENAQFIGSSKGFDLFDIITWDAAEQFVVENTQNNAAQTYVNDRQTFENNINESQHLYFFARENTNQVFGAAVKSNSTSSNVTFKNNGSNSVSVRCNFLFESALRENSLASDLILPLYLIPGSTFADVHDGCLIEEGVLKACLPQLTQQERAAEYTPADTVHSIASNAFTYGLVIGSIIIPDTIESLEENSMNGINTINVTAFENQWGDAWLRGCSDRVNYGYGATEEERARIAAERERAEREEAERIERERQEAERIAQEKAAREARKLRYKVEGKNITIKGTLPGVTELEIPEEIDGKPVTKIESYAFYDNEDIVNVQIPNTVKLIEQGAFMNCPSLHTVYVPKDCIIGPNAFLGSAKFSRRSYY